MKYGHFDDEAMEYVMDTPATPLPWINYLGNDSFFSLISNTGGGYSFFRDAKLRRITRYRYNGVPVDAGGRCYYIQDGDCSWSPCYLPLKTELDAYRCRHGLGYTVFETEKNDLAARLTCFVPLGEPCEINCLVLENKSHAPKQVRLFSAVEWCLWNAVDDNANFQRNYNIGEVEVEGSVIYHKSEYRERRNHYAYFGVNAPLAGFDTDRGRFLGQFNGWDSPVVVREGRSGNSAAHGWAPIASHHILVTLAPGQSRSLIFTLGYAELEEDAKWASPGVVNKEPAQALLARLGSDEKVWEAFGALKRYWKELLGRFSVQTGQEKLDRMVNIWNQYQCMVTFNFSRSASYYESGMGRGMGFRDSCQDLLGFVHLIPERARARILDIAAVQLEDGSTWHQYQPLTRQGNADVGGGFNDDPLWLVACTAAYIKETGDASILDAPVAFDTKPGTEAPLFEHLRRSIQYTLTHLGPHGLPLIGRADWNDCLNLNCFSDQPGESFQTCSNFDSGIAESVFIAGLFVLYGREYAELCRRFGSISEAEATESEVKRMEQTILTNGWDGQWFLRAFDAFGHKVGSAGCEEGQIYIEPQGICVMAGVGTESGEAKAALQSVRDRLTTPYGICLLDPCYTRYYKRLGEISSYPPGFKENGGIFCHNNPWISIAETKLGNADEAFAAYRNICPAYLEDISEIHRTEPYVYSQMIAGRAAPTMGEAKNSWLTGTAAWAFVNVSQYLLGIQPTFDGLAVRPCLPAHLQGFRAQRFYQGAKYCIQVGRGESPGMTVDGAAVSGTVIPRAPEGAVCQVQIVI